MEVVVVPPGGGTIQREVVAIVVVGHEEQESKQSEPDHAMAERLHEIIRASAPSLSPRTWYGMPAYARDGQIICHF